MEDIIYTLILDKKRLLNYTKYGTHSLLANSFVKIFIDDSPLINLEKKYIDLISFYDIYGLTGSEFIDIKSLKDLYEKVQYKKENILPITQKLYKLISGQHTDLIKILIDFREEILADQEIKANDVIWIKNLCNQLTELAYFGVDSSLLLKAFNNYDNFILEIITSDLILKDYQNLRILTLAYSIEPDLTNSLVDSYWNKFSYFPTQQTEQDIQAEWETKMMEVIEGKARKNTTKFYDTISLITQSLLEIEDIENIDLGGLITKIGTEMQKSNIKEVNNELTEISNQIAQFLNKIIQTQKLEYMTMIKQLEKLEPKPLEFQVFNQYLQILEMFNGIGIYYYFKADGKIIIEINTHVLEKYLKHYRTS